MRLENNFHGLDADVHTGVSSSLELWSTTPYNVQCLVLPGAPVGVEPPMTDVGNTGFPIDGTWALHQFALYDGVPGSGEVDIPGRIIAEM